MLGRMVWIDAPFGAAGPKGVVEIIAFKIGIDLVGVSGKQHRDIGRGGARRRKNKNRHDILFGAGLYADAIDTAWQTGGHLKDKISVPAAIIKIVFMKMHGGILIGRVGPAQ